MSSVSIKLRKCLSEAIRLVKTFDTTTGIDITLSGDFREGQSILTPEFTIESAVNLSDYNYCEIATFGRSYFMKVTAVQTNIWKLTLDVDVLSTYATGIKACDAFVKRTEAPDKINFYMNDGSLYTEQREVITYQTFKKNNADASLGTDSYYLMVAGG